jgi:AcrR family transcriptional regulator
MVAPRQRYQRARSPAQKAERREGILDAARRMLEANVGSSDLSLNELARQVGMAKSNLYRYFESREAVLLALLTEESRRWADEMARALETIDRQDAVDARLVAVAEVLATSAASRPAMCHLFSVMPSVLEHNVSLETVRAFKLESLALLGELATAMHSAVPELPAQGHAELLHHAFAFMVGGWPLANPAEMAAEVMRDPALAAFRHDFEADLRRSFLLMARGLLSETGVA